MDRGKEKEKEMFNLKSGYDRAKKQKLEKSVLLVCMTDYPEMNKLHDELTKKIQIFCFRSLILDHRSGRFLKTL